jgi:hypothetical protein
MLCRIFVIAVLSTVMSLGMAEASTITADLFSPLAPAGSTPTVIDLTGITDPLQAPLTGTGYSISFAGVGSNQGLVQGNLGGAHAVPVAGVTGGSAEYMSGGFGSPQTTNVGVSANYLSTGPGTITISFVSPVTSFALLWGSIDTGNSLRFNDASNFVVTGSAVQAAAAGFVSNGFQGPGGSAYVVVNTDTPFTSVTATSSVISFEFAPLAASSTPFDPPGAPEPEALTLMAGGILLLAAHRLRSRKRMS